MNQCLRRLVCLSPRKIDRRDSLLIRLAICALFPLFLNACAGTDSRPFPYYFDRLEIIAASSPVDIPLAQSWADKAKDVPQNIASGGAAAAAAGVAAGLGLSLVCGPLFVACAGTLVPISMAPVLAVSAVGGGASILVGMSEEETGPVNDYFETLPNRRDLNQELIIAVSATLPGARLATASGDARLTLGVQSVSFIRELPNIFRLYLLFEADMEWNPGNKKKDNARRTFDCYSEYHTLSTWLAGGGQEFDKAIDLCLKNVSRQITTAVMKKEGAAGA